jgi:hypothetical protein
MITVDGKLKLSTALMDVDASATMHLARTQTDYLGRMDQSLADIQNTFDEYPDSEVIDRNQAETLYEALTDLAGLATAQAAILLEQHPSIARTAGEGL